MDFFPTSTNHEHIRKKLNQFHVVSKACLYEEMFNNYLLYMKTNKNKTLPDIKVGT